MVLLATFPLEYAEEGSLSAVSPDGHLVAFGKGNSIVVLATARPYSPLRLCDTPAEQGPVTSLAWLSVAGGACCVAYGTAQGQLGLLDREAIFHVATLHRAPLCALRARTALRSPPWTAYAPVPEELLALHADGVLVLVAGPSLVRVLKQCAGDLWTDTPGGGTLGLGSPTTAQPPPAPDAEAALQLCRVALASDGGDRQTVADVAACGPLLGSALDVFAQDATRHVLVVGSNPTVACYDFRAQANDFSAAGALKAVTKTVAKAGVAVLRGGIRRVGWIFGGAAEEAEEPPPEPREKVKRMCANHSLSDPERCAASVSVDPSGRFAAVADQLGRVLVIDVPLFCIVNVFKGYRDCQTAWLYSPPTEAAGTDSPTVGTFLVLYLPRRGVAEVWRMAPHMTRASAAKVGYGCRLVPPAQTFGAAVHAGHALSCFLLLANGDFHRLDARLALRAGPPGPGTAPPAEGLVDEAACLRVIAEAGDDPRDVLRAVLRADGPPTALRHMTQLALERLQALVAPEPATPLAPLPAYMATEEDSKSEYERCMTGQHALRETGHILHYLRQRHAVLQAYCLLQPYADHSTPPAPRFQSDWLALVDPKPPGGAALLSKAAEAETERRPVPVDVSIFLGFFDLRARAVCPVVDALEGSVKSQQLAAFLLGVLAGGGGAGLDALSPVRLTVLRSALHHLNVPDATLAALIALFVLHAPATRLFAVDPADMLQVLGPLLAAAPPPLLRSHPPDPRWLPELLAAAAVGRAGSGGATALLPAVVRLAHRSAAPRPALLLQHLVLRALAGAGRAGEPLAHRLAALNALGWDLLQLLSVTDRPLSLRHVTEASSFYRVLAEGHLARQGHYLGGDLAEGDLEAATEPQGDVQQVLADVSGASPTGLQLFHFHCADLCARRYLDEIRDPALARRLHGAVQAHLRHLPTAGGPPRPAQARWFTGPALALEGWVVALVCVHHVATLWYLPLGALLAASVKDSVLVTQELAAKVVQLSGPVLQTHLDAVRSLVAGFLETIGRLQPVSHQVVRDAHALARQYVPGCSWRDQELADPVFHKTLAAFLRRFPEDTPLSHHRDAFRGQTHVLDLLAAGLELDVAEPLQPAAYLPRSVLFYLCPGLGGGGAGEDAFEDCLLRPPSDGWADLDAYFAEPGLAPIDALIRRCPTTQYRQIQQLFRALFPDSAPDAVLVRMAQTAALRLDAPTLDALVGAVGDEHRPLLSRRLFAAALAWLAALHDGLGRAAMAAPPGDDPLSALPTLQATFPTELLQEPPGVTAERLPDKDDHGREAILRLLRRTQRGAQAAMTAMEESPLQGRVRPPQYRQCQKVIQYCVDGAKALTRPPPAAP